MKVLMSLMLFVFVACASTHKTNQVAEQESQDEKDKKTTSRLPSAERWSPGIERR